MLGDMKDQIQPSLQAGKESSINWFTVTDRKAAKLLSDPEARRWLEPFLGQETTIKNAAQTLDLSLNTMLHKTRRLEKVGLVKVTKVQKRKGRAIKYYQTVADAFFIPYSASPYASPEEWLIEDFKSREDILSENIMKSGMAWAKEQGYDSFGKRVFMSSNRKLTADFAFGPQEEVNLLHPNAPAIFTTFSELHLTQEKAKELQTELIQLFGKYQQSENQGSSQSYLLRLAMAKISDSSNQ